MTGETTRTARSRRWTRWCAALLLALLALTALHAAVPHDPVRRHCMACQALHAPAVAEPGSAPGRVEGRAAVGPATRPDRPVSAGVSRLRPLRAPPACA